MIKKTYDHCFYHNLNFLNVPSKPQIDTRKTLLLFNFDWNIGILSIIMLLVISKKQENFDSMAIEIRFISMSLLNIEVFMMK